MDIEKDFGDEYFKSRYGKLHYKKHAGGGTPVVFLHGLAGSVRTWTRLMKFVPAGIDAYLIDLLGHGDSDAPDIEYAFKVHYDAVSSLIDDLDLQGYFVFGHSYGGWIAAYTAMQNDIGGVILEDSAGLKEFYDERLAANPEYVEDMIQRARSLNPHENVLRSMLESDNSDDFLTRSNLAGIDSRALIIWGEKDTTVGLKYAQDFRRYIKNSRLEILKGGRHTPHYTNPEAVARLVSGFVSAD